MATSIREPLADGIIGKGITGIYGMADEMQGKYAAVDEGKAAKLKANVGLHAWSNGLIYVVEAGPEAIMPFSCYVSTLGNNVSPDILSQSVNYGRGIFEGEKYVRINGKDYLVHPNDNEDRMRWTAQKFGYWFDYSSAKLTYLKIATFLFNGFANKWPALENGAAASIVYGRMLVTKPLRSGIGVGGNHPSTLSFIAWPMGLYFNEDTVRNGANVLFDFPTANTSIATDGEVHKLNKRYEDASRLREMAQDMKMNTAETIEIVDGKLKEGSSDTVALICGNMIICPPHKGTRLNAITIRFVEKIAPQLGLQLEYRDIRVAELLRCEGMMLLGNAVNILGVNKAYFREADLTGTGAPEPVERFNVRINGAETETGMVAYQYKTTRLGTFQMLKDAFERAWSTNDFGKYAICMNDIVNPDAVELMEKIGKQMRRQLSSDAHGRPRKNNILPLNLPNVLRTGAEEGLVLGNRLWPAPGIREPSAADVKFIEGLRRQPQLLRR